MCFGVRDALNLALQQSGPMTILGDLVHNESVLNQLRHQGVQTRHQVADVSTDNVMITAHGTSNRIRDAIRQRGLTMVEATCPLVHFAHQSVLHLVSQGYHPVIIGQRDHVEVRGLTGDLEAYDVVLSEEEVDQLSPRPAFGLAAQTTQPMHRVLPLVERVRNRFPQSRFRFVDTVCQPTKQRQSAAEALARQCDVVLVIGGRHSNNTAELVATCRRHCERVHHIQGADDLHGDWFEDAGTVGLTAGTSTPDSLVDDVESWLRGFLSFQRELKQRSQTLSLSHD